MVIAQSSDTRTIEIEVKGESIWLYGERAAYWSKRRALIVSDIHLGKAETFQAHGIAVASAILEDDLARLSRAILRSKTERLIVVGDLLHSSTGLTPRVVERVAKFIEAHSLQVILVRGNHDRAPIPEEWNVALVESIWTDGPFTFAHDPEETSKGFVWSGHLHPMIHLRSRQDHLRLPCFHFMRARCVLPAFSAFTGGISIQRKRSDRVFAIAEDHLIEV